LGIEGGGVCCLDSSEVGPLYVGELVGDEDGVVVGGSRVGELVIGGADSVVSMLGLTVRSLL
jgi:hypothetical protein